MLATVMGYRPDGDLPGWHQVTRDEVQRLDSQDFRETRRAFRPSKGKSITIGVGVAVGAALTASLVALFVFHAPYWSLPPIAATAIGLGALAGRAVYGYQSSCIERQYAGLLSFSRRREPSQPPPPPDEPYYTGL